MRPRTIGEIAEGLGVTQQAASKAAAELTRLGYLDGLADPQDRRIRRVTLSARGREAVSDARRARQDLEALLASEIGESERPRPAPPSVRSSNSRAALTRPAAGASTRHWSTEDSGPVDASPHSRHTHRPMPNYSLVIFDFDGTLADSVPWFMTALDRTADRFSLKRVDPAEIESCACCRAAMR